MGPGSFGTGKSAGRRVLGCLWAAAASMGPGSFGTGKAHSLMSLPHGRVVASMGPGSFGTGKKADGCRLNPLTGIKLQWGPVLLEPGSGIRRRRERRAHPVPASMGPGSFGTGKSPRATKRNADRRSSCFNGARFFWNREGPAGHAGGNTAAFRGFGECLGDGRVHGRAPGCLQLGKGLK